MHSEKLTFQNEAGATLAARLERPAGAPRAFALFAHCFTCSKDLHAARTISRALAEEGLAVLRFDFTGLGESEGDFADTTFFSNTQDLVAAARFLGAEYEPPALLVGHSLGGAAVLQAARRLESVQAVATIGAPAEPAHVTRLLDGAVEEIEREGAAQVTLAGRTFTITKQFLDDLDAHEMQQAVGALGRGLLLFHSPTDQSVGIENAARLFEAARHPKSFVSLAGADHLLTDLDDARYVARVLAAWASRFLESEMALPEEAPHEERGVLARTFEEGFRTSLTTPDHTFVADEPEHVGGTNEGPTPYDLLAAALASCTTMTLRMYADRKGWMLEEARVQVTHEKIHAEDCQHCETEDGRLDRLERTVQLLGPLTDRQRQRLLEIADRCPVHQTLQGEIDVHTRMAGPEITSDE